MFTDRRRTMLAAGFQFTGVLHFKTLMLVIALLILSADSPAAALPMAISRGNFNGTTNITSLSLDEPVNTPSVIRPANGATGSVYVSMRGNCAGGIIRGRAGLCRDCASLQDCVSACDRSEQCAGVSWRAEPNACYLKKAPCLQATHSRAGFTFYRRDALVNEGWPLYTRFSGNCPNRHLLVNGSSQCSSCLTMPACKQLCDAVVACRGFSWDFVDSCFLKSSSCSANETVRGGFVFFRKDELPTTNVSDTVELNLIAGLANTSHWQSLYNESFRNNITTDSSLPVTWFSTGGPTLTVGNVTVLSSLGNHTAPHQRNTSQIFISKDHMNFSTKPKPTTSWKKLTASHKPISVPRWQGTTTMRMHHITVRTKPIGSELTQKPIDTTASFTLRARTRDVPDTTMKQQPETSKRNSFVYVSTTKPAKFGTTLRHSRSSSMLPMTRYTTRGRRRPRPNFLTRFFTRAPRKTTVRDEHTTARVSFLPERTQHIDRLTTSAHQVRRSTSSHRLPTSPRMTQIVEQSTTDRPGSTEVQHVLKLTSTRAETSLMSSFGVNTWKTPTASVQPERAKITKSVGVGLPNRRVHVASRTSGRPVSGTTALPTNTVRTHRTTTLKTVSETTAQTALKKDFTTKRLPFTKLERNIASGSSRHDPPLATTTTAVHGRTKISTQDSASSQWPVSASRTTRQVFPSRAATILEVAPTILTSIRRHTSEQALTRAALQNFTGTAVTSEFAALSLPATTRGGEHTHSTRKTGESVSVATNAGLASTSSVGETSLKQAVVTQGDTATATRMAATTAGRTITTAGHKASVTTATPLLTLTANVTNTTKTPPPPVVQRSTGQKKPKSYVTKDELIIACIVTALVTLFAFALLAFAAVKLFQLYKAKRGMHTVSPGKYENQYNGNQNNADGPRSKSQMSNASERINPRTFDV